VGFTQFEPELEADSKGKASSKPAATASASSSAAAPSAAAAKANASGTEQQKKKKKKKLEQVWYFPFDGVETVVHGCRQLHKTKSAFQTVEVGVSCGLKVCTRV
jgi:hypothetical protein